MQGFADDTDATVQRPPIPIDEHTRDRLVRVMASVGGGATPEEISGYLEDGFPAEVDEQLERPLEREEMSDYVDVFLAALQHGAVQAAA